MATEHTPYQVFFATQGVDPGLARVRSFHTREGLSVSFVAELEIEIPGTDIDPHAWLLSRAQVVMARQSDGAVLRRLSGLVTRVLERATALGDRQRVSLTVESPLAALKLITDHRLFQDMTTEGIARILLEEAGLDGAEVAFRLSGSYAKREVCTQFGETSFDFLSRILEEDGIFYFFEFDEAGSLLVFADASSALAKAATPEVVFRPESTLAAQEAVASIAEVERVRPAKVTLRDHDFKRPSLDLTAEAADEAPLGRELYDYPGRYVDPAEGRRRAAAFLDALRTEARCIRCVGGTSALLPGHTFALTGAPAGDLDRTWVVRELEQRWEDRAGAADAQGARGPGRGAAPADDPGGALDVDLTRLTSTFTALPEDAVLRPSRRTPRAAVPGPQIAKVRGPAGSEIHCDEHGRVKVSFVWDRRSTQDERSSAWVRVGQQFLSGALAIPRVGWEVLVDFEDGDPDRPIVVGRVYNAIFAPPYKLPDGKTMTGLKSLSTPGGGGSNEIRMEDAAGSEQVMVHAQKDANIAVANDRDEKIAVHESRVVGANQSVSIGADQTVDIGAASELQVAGVQQWEVGASRTKTVSGDEKVDIKGARSLTIGGSHTQLTPMSTSITTAGSLSETVGGSCVEVAALSASMAVAGAASVSVGAAKIEAAASGRSELTVGAHASTVGGALITAAGGDVNVGVGGAKATTVGGIWAAAAGGDVQLTASSALSILVGGAVALNAGKIVLKVGGSNVTVANGAVSIKSKTIKLIATGPHAELAPMVEDK
ncbi:type VI secretion system Vgr family protein [Sorangium sp. So ce406]|uniref:type VI secretion system Vgr family protein n=1 Tax=Sorangium sp. So ce406 TaxID=3133311 RepID=UPI003F5C91EB